eukprot:381542-Amphidinium_carterae.1
MNFRTHFSSRRLGGVPGQPALFAEWTLFDNELWLTEAPAGKDAEGATLSSHKVALGEDDDITSLPADYLTEELSSSDEDDFIWELLEPTKCPQTFAARGCASEIEKWSFYLKMAKHMEEVDEDVASYAASQPKSTSRAKLSWRKTKSLRQGGGVHAELDREVPGLASPLLMKRRHLMPSMGE